MPGVEPGLRTLRAPQPHVASLAHPSREAHGARLRERAQLRGRLVNCALLYRDYPTASRPRGAPYTCRQTKTKAGQ